MIDDAVLIACLKVGTTCGKPNTVMVCRSVSVKYRIDKQVQGPSAGSVGVMVTGASEGVPVG